MARTLSALLAVVCWPLVAGQSTTAAPWVSAEDTTALKQAEDAADIYCNMGADTEVDKEGGRATMESAIGGQNVVLEAMKEAGTADGLGPTLSAKLSPGSLAVGAVGTVFAIIFLVWYFLCCWTCCPFCKCCRVCRGRRETPKKVKIGLIVVGCCILFAVIFSASYAYGGYYLAVDGVDNMACSVAEMIEGTLGGQEDPPFIGMMPLLNKFKDMEDSLDYSAGFMTDVRATIGSTASISDAVGAASATLTLLKTAFDNMPPEIQANKHKCQFCESLSPVLAQTASALDGGVGASLAAARAEIDRQLSPEMSKKLQDSLRQAAGPLADMKKTVRDSFGFFTDTDKFLQVRGHLEGDGPQTVLWIVSVLIMFALLLVVFMMFALIWFFFREDYETTSETGETTRKFSKVTHRVAACNWCCGWYFVIIAFLVGGLLGVVSYALSSMCLIMDDLDKQMLMDIGPSLGMDFATDDGKMFLNILDKCFVPADPTLNAALMDLVTVPGNETGKTITMREKFVDEIKANIDMAFADVDKFGAGNNTLANSTEVMNLRSMLGNNPIDTLIVLTDPTSLLAEADYQPITTESTLNSALAASVACGPHTVSAEVPTVGGNTILGVEAFVAANAAFGTRQTVRADCADAVTCVSAACTAANRLVTLKQTIRDLTNYRCDVFVDPSDNVSDCDPLNMAAGTPVNGKTPYTNTCIFPDGTTRPKQKNCNLNDFIAYVSGFDTRIDKVFKRVDTVVAETGPSITGTLRGLVNQYLLVPIVDIVNGVTCGFIAVLYRRIVDGLCYQSVVGFTRIGQSYVASAVLTLFLIILMYGLWRRAVDNVNDQAKSQIVPEEIEIGNNEIK